MHGAFLMAASSLMEPMYRVDICNKSSTLEGVCSILGNRGRTVINAICVEQRMAMQVVCVFSMACSASQKKKKKKG
eukprot:1533110-Ditylum_brightwellii.AAC.1